MSGSGKPLHPWKTLSRRTVYQPSGFLTVELHTVELPDGRRIEEWPWLIVPDFVNVLARTDDDRFVCFWQTKYAVDGVSLATVAGIIEPGEEPLSAAQRELREEAGYEAREWRALGRYAVDANRGAGNAHMFLALGAHRVCDPHGGDLEEQEIVMLTRDQLQQALARSEFKALAWAAVVALGLWHVDGEHH